MFEPDEAARLEEARIGREEGVFSFVPFFGGRYHRPGPVIQCQAQQLTRT